jgi:dUTP pyrophosphatase
VSASERVVVAGRSRAVVGTGVKLSMPSNVYGDDKQVVMFATLKGRSGLAKKGIDVHAGTIDCDYRGEIKAIVINNTDEDFEIRPGDRVAQLIFGMALVPDMVACEDVAVASPTQRGADGFGSTGIRALNDEVKVAIEPGGSSAVEAHIVVSEQCDGPDAASASGGEAA